MKEMTAKNETEAKREAAIISKANPGMYVTVAACFGLFATVAKRLHVFAPSDSTFKWYALNGIVKPFTVRQKIADDMATPVMS